MKKSKDNLRVFQNPESIVEKTSNNAQFVTVRLIQAALESMK